VQVDERDDPNAVAEGQSRVGGVNGCAVVRVGCRDARDLALRLGVPELEGPVGACRDEASPVAREGAGVDLVAGPLEGRLATTRLSVPELEGPVVACRDEAPPVGREGAGSNPFCVPRERANQGLGLPLSRAQVEPDEAAQRAAPGRLSRDPLRGFALGDVPLQTVVELLEDELRGAPEVGRQEVVQLAGVVAREGLEYLVLMGSIHDASKSAPTRPSSDNPVISMTR